MKLKKDKNDYSEETVKKKRKFPALNTVLLVLCIVAQIALVLVAVIFTPQPQDVIKDYKVNVIPLADGTLDIEYNFVWQALDSSEELTWVEIGMANDNYSVYYGSLSSSIGSYSYVEDGDYTALRLDFNDSYSDGEIVEFSFKINQGSMLCKADSEYFYEFVPGWFNTIAVERYEFSWEKGDECTYADGAEEVNGSYVWSGSLDFGGYRIMKVGYSSDAFNNPSTVRYAPFDDSGAYNDLKSEKSGFVVFVVILCLGLAVAEIFILDSYVSYGRGRGFLVGHGYYVHTYGRKNPHYVRAHAQYNSSRSGRSGGGGCACACACACAGGGRAGCSQKDTYSNKK